MRKRVRITQKKHKFGTLKRRKPLIRLTSSKLIYFSLIFVVVLVLLFLLNHYGKQVLSSIQPREKESLVIPNSHMNDLSDFQKALAKNHISLESVEQSSESGKIIGVSHDKMKIIFSQDKDVAWQVSTLQQLLAHFTINKDSNGEIPAFRTKVPSEIDFTFDKPIVRY